MPKFKSNDRMIAPTQRNIDHFTDAINDLHITHRRPAQHFADEVGPRGLFEILHSMRRWYSGQTMARKLLSHRDALRDVMDIEPHHAIGVYRGFKIPKDNPLAKRAVGDELTLPVKRNHGFSSWSTTEAPTHRFSGGGRGMVGLVVKLVDDAGIKPVLAPPSAADPGSTRCTRRRSGSPIARRRASTSSRRRRSA